MEKNYKTLTMLFIAIAVISILGFYKSYFQFFPKFENTTFFTHIHFVIFLSWFAILIGQPILIRQKKFSLHRKIGQFSYFLAPIMVISILVMVKLTIANNLSVSNQQAAIGSVGAFLDAVSFATLYVLSIVNKQNVRKHVAFMIGASLIILNPGLGRLVGNTIGQPFGILAMVIMPYLISIGILLYEKFKLKRPLFKSPYLLVALIWTIELALFVWLPNTDFWQNVMKIIAVI